MVTSISIFRYSRQDLTNIFAFCVIATHSWSIFNMFRHVASWSLSLSIWDLLGTVSYTLISVLFEAIVFFLVVVLFGRLLPKKWIRDRTIAISGVIVVYVTILAIVVKPFVIAGDFGNSPMLFAVLLIAMISIAILVLRICGLKRR
jgi:CBS domain containing-hemolysin-like protein